jgi:hypothetical protein
VTDIVNVPADGIIGEAINLGAATVAPANASYKTIVWSASGAGLTASSVEPFSAVATGTLTLTATIVNGAAAGNYTKNFTIPITTIRPVTGIDGIASGTYSAGTTIDLNTARATPANATNKTIVWRIKTAGAGVSAIGADSAFTLTAGGTLVLTATIANGREGSPGILSDYTEDFAFFVDKIVVPGEVDLGEDASIKLYANGGSDPLPADVTIRVDRDTEYYVNVDPAAGYSNIVWRLNGTVSTVTGGKLYLDTARTGTVVVTVEAEKGGVADDGVYTFIIE